MKKLVIGIIAAVLVVVFAGEYLRRLDEETLRETWLPESEDDPDNPEDWRDVAWEGEGV